MMDVVEAQIERKALSNPMQQTVCVCVLSVYMGERVHVSDYPISHLTGLLGS